MYIKSMTLDGFKSYGQKTQIDGFDRLFNAITGLNGSGKSNILDAICFVLGLQNMSLARCTNLRDLIYKNGQTGVTKAAVAITFDNRNKEQSPTGYEQYDEIVITREVNLNSRSKYWINGFSAQNNQIGDFFHSVQLNIHNPHFLIMQGRITKVLNMKPNEILAMVEEATGVSMYEAKKKSTRVLMEKKDFALRNIDELINETIVPKLDQLKKEQSGLMEYQKVTAEHEHLMKIYVAYSFVREDENRQKATDKISEKQNEIDKLKNNIEDAEKQIKVATKNISVLEKKKDEEFGGRLEELEKCLNSEQMRETKLISDLNHQNENLKEIQKKRAQVFKNLEGDKRITVSKQKEYDKIKALMDTYAEESTHHEMQLKKAEKDFEAISAGLSRSADGEANATLADQLMSAKNEIATAETDMKKADMKMKHLRTELSKKEIEVKKHQNIIDKDRREIDSMNKDVEKMANELKKINFDENRHTNLKGEITQLKRKIDQLRDEITNSDGDVWRAKFEYTDPIPNFDRSKVLGSVCNLLNLKDDRAAYAIEKAAGGKLYNVVIENEQIGKMLIDKKSMKQRRTLIPLNKVSSREFDYRALRAAERLVGKDNVCSAISLVEYEPHLAPAMEFVFGDTLVCTNMEMAQKVAFARDVQKRTVTYDGEVYDPSGTLSGGARESGGFILIKIAEVQNKKRILENLQNQLKEMDNELRHLETVAKQYFNLKNQFELKQRETEFVKQRLQQGDEHRLVQEIEEMRNTIVELETVVKDSGEKKSKAMKNVEELQNKMKNAKSIRERELKEAEVNLSKARKDVEKSRKQFDENRQKTESLTLEIEELNKAADVCEEHLREFGDNINHLENEIENLTVNVTDATGKVTIAHGDVKEHKKLLKAQSDEISKMQKEKENIVKQIENMNLQIKQLDHEIGKIESSSKDSEKNVKMYLKKYPWINEEKSLFGNETAGYGFNNPNFNPNEINRRIEKLKSTKTALSKTVNMRANIMLSDKEKESEELSKKRKIISNDRDKLITYMEEVDQKKKDALSKAWERINTDFGSIFATFLPNSNAKLTAPHGKTILDGLEVKVAFGDVWKESLTELSGGQRSLVALSLILALLKFNPAPLYILDEVDAALDQNHTQNTGIMIRKHFKHSQFIIVSLKDDMFNNANVLYKTRFVDGTSVVSRLTRQTN